MKLAVVAGAEVIGPVDEELDEEIDSERDTEVALLNEALLDGAEVIGAVDEELDAGIELLELKDVEEDVILAEFDLLDADVLGSVGDGVKVGFITVGTVSGQAQVDRSVVVVPVTSQPVAVEEQVVVGQVVVRDESPDAVVDTWQVM